MLKIKIYSGLSVQAPMVHKYLPSAIFSRPIKRDDILKDIQNGVQVIGIIDGEFLQNLSVSPTEIRDAMRCGLSVYGSSSMGAMRAAELSPFGMIGVGRIFEQIVSAPYFRDDKLGQIFYDDIKMISTPFMDLQIGMEDLVKRRLIGAPIAMEILKIYQRLHFADRSFSALKAEIRKSIKNQNKLLQAVETMQKNNISQKKLDAICLLKKIRSDINKTSSIMKSLP
jgi:hypothetical protein